MARIIALTGGIEAVDKLYDAIDRVTPEDIRHAAEKYLSTQPPHGDGAERGEVERGKIIARYIEFIPSCAMRRFRGKGL